jgi:hypothetical protein
LLRVIRSDRNAVSCFPDGVVCALAREHHGPFRRHVLEELVEADPVPIDWRQGRVHHGRVERSQDCRDEALGDRWPKPDGWVRAGKTLHIEPLRSVADQHHADPTRTPLLGFGGSADDDVHAVDPSERS